MRPRPGLRLLDQLRRARELVDLHSAEIFRRAELLPETLGIGVLGVNALHVDGTGYGRVNELDADMFGRQRVPRQGVIGKDHGYLRLVLHEIGRAHV